CVLSSSPLSSSLELPSTATSDSVSTGRRRDTRISISSRVPVSTTAVESFGGGTVGHSTASVHSTQCARRRWTEITSRALGRGTVSPSRDTRLLTGARARDPSATACPISQKWTRSDHIPHSHNTIRNKPL
ncbi:hypothetical protein PMAYCL1PPCAC_31111, partial [Pristionchus mayeri]